MSSARRRGAKEARNEFPDLLTAAEKGDSTIITRQGRPVAALVPIEHLDWGLTPREGEVFRLLALGHTSREIGDELSVSVEKVRTHISRIFAKTGICSIAEIVVAARPRQQSILALQGTGRGLWGRSSTRTIRKLRGEWDR